MYWPTNSHFHFFIKTNCCIWIVKTPSVDLIDNTINWLTSNMNPVPWSYYQFKLMIVWMRSNPGKSIATTPKQGLGWLGVYWLRKWFSQGFTFFGQRVLLVLDLSYALVSAPLSTLLDQHHESPGPPSWWACRSSPRRAAGIPALSCRSRGQAWCRAREPPSRDRLSWDPGMDRADRRLESSTAFIQGTL